VPEAVANVERLLNPHYFYAEMQFILALMDIGERLVNVPREARRTYGGRRRRSIPPALNMIALRWTGTARLQRRRWRPS